MTLSLHLSLFFTFFFPLVLVVFHHYHLLPPFILKSFPYNTLEAVYITACTQYKAQVYRKDANINIVVIILFISTLHTRFSHWYTDGKVCRELTPNPSSFWYSTCLHLVWLSGHSPTCMQAKQSRHSFWQRNFLLYGYRKIMVAHR